MLCTLGSDDLAEIAVHTEIHIHAHKHARTTAPPSANDLCDICARIRSFSIYFLFHAFSAVDKLFGNSASFFAQTNDLFTWVLFAQYLGSAIMICGVLYTISSVVVSAAHDNPNFPHNIARCTQTHNHSVKRCGARTRHALYCLQVVYYGTA